MMTFFHRIMWHVMHIRHYGSSPYQLHCILRFDFEDWNVYVNLQEEE